MQERETQPEPVDVIVQALKMTKASELEAVRVRGCTSADAGFALKRMRELEAHPEYYAAASGRGFFAVTKQEYDALIDAGAKPVRRSA